MNVDVVSNRPITTREQGVRTSSVPMNDDDDVSLILRLVRTFRLWLSQWRLSSSTGTIPFVLWVLVLHGRIG